MFGVFFCFLFDKKTIFLYVPIWQLLNFVFAPLLIVTLAFAKFYDSIIIGQREDTYVSYGSNYPSIRL